jgi:uncharacterized repeat protein (TIGR03803 family)
MTKRIACIAFLFCAVTTIRSAAQAFTTLINFDGTNGESPTYMSLIQGLDGNLYGTASLGGASNAGTVFKITAEGKLTT